MRLKNIFDLALAILMFILAVILLATSTILLILNIEEVCASSIFSLLIFIGMLATGLTLVELVSKLRLYRG